LTHKHIVYIVFFIFSSKAICQTKYPQGYFRNPLEIPIILAGTFGELRTSHFHSGLDLKTQQKEGLRVHTAAEGYVSRIKVSNWGYGKALYITHPNGYTTVYAHLKKFNNKIEQYVKKHQYQKEKEEIQLFPQKTDFIIKKDEIIAYSGSTGGYIAPHLHFEIRNTKTEKIINPMHFGLIPKDSKTPIINHLRAYSFSDSSHVNSSNIEIPLNFKQLKTGIYRTDETIAYGNIGFAINTYDQQDGALNKNGIYKLEMFLNDKKYFEHKVETFSFNESKYINLLIDYPYYKKFRRKYQKTYIHPENKLSTYNRKLGKGYLNIKANRNYQVLILVTDFAGNTSKLTIPIRGVKQSPRITRKKRKTDYFIEKESEKIIKFKNTQISFSRNTFYENIFLEIENNNDNITIYNSNLPVNKNYSISFDVSEYSKPEKEKLYIAQISNKKYYNYCKTIKSDSVFTTKTKNLGVFTLHKDSEAPVISDCSFYENQNVSKYHFFTIKVIDEISGLKEYRGEIDGRWIRLELNLKTNTLTFDFSDIKLKKGKHTFTLIAMDNVGNTRTFTSLFLLK
jgi:very-short-patch-repair endonuclease